MEIVCHNCNHVNITRPNRRLSYCRKCRIQLEGVSSKNNHLVRENYKNNQKIQERRLLSNRSSRRKDENFGKRSSKSTDSKDYKNLKSIKKQIRKERFDKVSSVELQEALNASANDIVPVSRFNFKSFKKAESGTVENTAKPIKAIKEIRKKDKPVIKQVGIVDKIKNIINYFLLRVLASDEKESKEVKPEVKEDKKNEEYNNFINEVKNEVEDLENIVKQKIDKEEFKPTPWERFVDKIADYLRDKIKSFKQDFLEKTSNYRSGNVYGKIIVFLVFALIITVFINKYSAETNSPEDKSNVTNIPVVDTSNLQDKARKNNLVVNDLSENNIISGEDPEVAKDAKSKEELTNNKAEEIEQQVIKLDEDTILSPEVLREELKGLDKKEEQKAEKAGKSTKRALARREIKDNLFFPVKVNKIESFWETSNKIRNFKTVFSFTNVKSVAYEVPAVEIIFLNTKGEEIARDIVNINRTLQPNEIATISMGFQNIPFNTSDFYVFIYKDVIKK